MNACTVTKVIVIYIFELISKYLNHSLLSAGMPLNAQLPEYSFEQTMEKVTFVVKVKNVQVQDISLGFTHQQVDFFFSAFLSTDEPVWV